MNKINASLISLGIVFALTSCKKDKVSKVDCEIKLTRHHSSIISDSLEDIITRFNSTKQIIDVVTPRATFTYIYQGKEVTVRSGGNDVYKIVLDNNGQAVSLLSTLSKNLQKISYDSEGRIKQISLETEGTINDVYTYYYVSGNVDYIIHENKEFESKISFEYTNLKSDARTESFQPFYGIELSSDILPTLRGLGSLNLPSKITREFNNGIPMSVQNYTYTIASDGRAIGVSFQSVTPSKAGGIVTTYNYNIASTCK